MHNIATTFLLLWVLFLLRLSSIIRTRYDEKKLHFCQTNIKIERIFIGKYVKYSRALYQRTASHNERARKIEDSWEFGVLMLCFYC